MSSSALPSSSGIGRLTALILGFVVFVCVTMIGGVGYLKYKLDTAETVLAATDGALGGDRGYYERLRQEWGFDGFLGLAQKFVFSRDASVIPKMKERIKTADQLISAMPSDTPPQMQRELISIASMFDDAMQKMESPTGNGDNINDFNAMDLPALYAALPVLDAHAASDVAQRRFAAQNSVKRWAMLLTVTTWWSLMIAATCATCIYFILRGRNSAPMRALAQSIQNMAQGDMRTAIWGIERQDMIGELARTIDIARYHFSHLPDISLLSEQGPVRLRFEGGSRSLFEAMMKAISGDAENIRELSSTLTSSVKQHKDAIGGLSMKVEAILQDILQRGQTGDKQLAQAVREMLGGAESLKNAHAHVTDQLNRLIPTIQDRAQGLAEITQIAGKQFTNTLQSLTLSETSLKANAEKTKETLVKLSSTADDLGERLFGAINLLQASGKVLGETTENIKSRWNEIIPPTSAQEWSDRLAEITKQLGSLQTKLDAQGEAQSGMAKTLEQSVAQDAAPDTTVETALAPLAGQVEQILGQLAGLQNKLNEQPAPPPAPPPVDLSPLQNKIDELADLEGKVAVFVSALPGDMRQAMRDEIQKLAEQTSTVGAEEKIAALQASFAALPDLSPKLAEIGVLVAGKLDEQRSTIEGKQQAFIAKFAAIEASIASAQQAAEAARDEVSKPKAPPTITLPPELQKQFLDQWFQMSAQIEASRTSMVESLSGLLGEMEGRLAAVRAPAAAPTVSAAKSAADYALQVQIEKQTEILGELVGTLTLLDAHMQQIRSAMNAA